MYGRNDGICLSPGVTVVNMLDFEARWKIARENIRIVSELAEQKRRTGSARQDAEMPESAEITDKTSEYFICQRTNVTSEKRLRRSSESPKLDMLTIGTKISMQSQNAKHYFFYYHELYHLLSLLIDMIRKNKNAMRFERCNFFVSRQLQHGINFYLLILLSHQFYFSNYIINFAVNLYFLKTYKN